MQETKTMIIEVLGSGCVNCKALEARTREAIDALGIDASIVKVTDVGEIVTRGVLTTPALAVDGRVVLSGRVPTVSELKRLLADVTS